MNARQRIRDLVRAAHVPDFVPSSLHFTTHPLSSSSSSPRGPHSTSGGPVGTPSSTSKANDTWAFVSKLLEPGDAQKLIKIRVVQNEAAWMRYEAERKLLEKRDGQAKVQERWLWHGTRYTEATKVACDFNGFDLTYCNDTAWGRGLYFASSARYAMNFTYKTRELLLCRVLVGKCISLPPDSSLRRPPSGYDSVHCAGETSSDNYVIYHSGARAYAAYIVTFA